MGSCQSNELVTDVSQVEYIISVTTGDKKGAGTNANVTVVLHNDGGQSTGHLHLDKFLRDDFERGKKDHFKVQAPFMSVIDMIEVWRDDAGLRDEWFLETVVVHCKNSNKIFVFPFLRWIKEGYHYKIRHLDTSLPQDDPYKEQRLMELNDKKTTYQTNIPNPGLPIQVKEIPDDERFSSDYQFDLVKLAAEITIKGKLVRLVSGEWDSLDDLGNIYKSEVFLKPTPLADNTWDTDEHFGFQRIGRINNSLITLCTEIPKKLAVTEEMLKPFLEGLKLQDALMEKKLFYVDLVIVEGIPVKSGLMVCAPVALFYHNKKNRLVPIAIQLKQQPADDNPVFLPSDPKYTWLAAKMWFNLADASYHESITHLGFTHLLMEGCAIATHRNLSHTHPIFKLLAPHFLYLIAINGLALTTLISSDGWVQNVMAIGIDGMFELIRRKLNTWRMDVDGTLPKELESRGVLDQTILSGYHYRDDALSLYNIVNNYVTEYVGLYYDSAESYTNDLEIQAWAQEFVKPRTEGGCGLLGVPGGGSITNSSDLVCILNFIIFTGSVTHAAANFAQYDEYGFPPNYPVVIKGTPPTNKAVLTESCILEALPDKALTFEIIIITKLLSAFGTNKLGDFEMKYIYDPKAENVLKRFQKELAEQSRRVKTLEKTREFSYKWLDPEIVPNAISI
ncbi:LOW QUALITY PROTEIN: allene oxide synthase-lipoxygenase protein-like [Pecten maximus]|uniref:LOW QUALITY PROTEIN: allene oxide synthase-lipoxygenase protein-like n=1 Tax=Pecten maximus TaxID=6579 RepID=UPI001458DF45|nr:LOW QUALITY PROTEIN: allene oxide synthase-lipoxygenase protein-like [Pecten maximus]